MTLESHVEACKQLTNDQDVIALVKEVIEHPLIFVFGELLELDIVQGLKTKSPETLKWFNLLELFAYGKLLDHNEQTMPALNDAMIKKLRLLTIVTLATSKKVGYSVLSDELKLNQLRDLEDLIIEAIYSNLVKGKLDQKAICLEVESTLARDVRQERIDDISTLLTNWIANCDGILNNIDKQGKVANSIKSENLARKIELESFVNQMKKTNQANNQDMEEVWEINSMHTNQEFDKFNKRNSYKQLRFSSRARNQRF